MLFLKLLRVTTPSTHKDIATPMTDVLSRLYCVVLKVVIRAAIKASTVLYQSSLRGYLQKL